MTPPGPTRDTPAGRAYLDLRNLARRNGRDPAEYLTLYTLEGLLARLARSPHATDFVLKGGVLMAAFTARRPTRDIDLAARQITNDADDVVARIRTIATIDTDDGLTFDTESVSGTTIRDDADYAGVRVKLTAHLATAQIALHVDVNVGDPIWPAPVDTALPLLLGGTKQPRATPHGATLSTFDKNYLVEVLQCYSHPGDLKMRRSEAIRAEIRVKTPDGIQTERQLPHRTPKLAADLIEQLIEAYQEGDSVYVLARRFGIHRQTVSRHLLRKGVAMRRKGWSIQRRSARSLRG